MNSGKKAIVAAALAAFLAGYPTSARAGDAAKARRDLMAARSSADASRWDDMDASMKKAAVDMQGLSDAEKAPLTADMAAIREMVTKSVEEDVTRRLDKAAKDDPAFAKGDIGRAAARLDSDEAKAYADPAVIAKLRARMAGMSGGAPTPATPSTPSAPATPPPSSTGNKPMSYELSAAKSRAHLAHSMLEQNDPRAAETAVHDTMRLLKDVPEADRGPVLDDLVDLNRQIDEVDAKARRAEEFRRVDERLHRYVFTAEQSFLDGVVVSPEWLDKSQELLGSNDVKTYMTAEQIGTYQAKVDALRIKLRKHNREVALARAEPIVKELEADLAADPFKGVEQGSAYVVYDKLKNLSDRARAEVRRGPGDDPDIKAMSDRVSAANAKIESAAGKFAGEKMQERFAGSWKFAAQGFAGWEAETLAPESASHFQVEGLTKTTQAVSGSLRWLDSADTKETLEKHKDNAMVAATAASAHKTLEDAAAKLSEGFNAVLADAEKQPVPARESDRARMAFLAQQAADWLAGTKYREPTVARAQALDAKWKAQVAQADKELQENLKKLTADANAAWPKIEMSVGAEKGFDPKEASQWKGKTIEIKGYYNRSGWDFDGAYDFAVDIKGMPVAGKYDPNVRAAFDEGSRHTKFGIDDHVGWDLIAVVEGTGQIKRRTRTEWRDKDTHELVLKTESYVAEPCVILKIIGLRAGPVAVGPK